MDSATAPSQQSPEINEPNLETGAPKHGPSDDATAADANTDVAGEGPPAKKARLEGEEEGDSSAPNGHVDGRRRGIAPVKAEYVGCLSSLAGRDNGG